MALMIMHYVDHMKSPPKDLDANSEANVMQCTNIKATSIPPETKQSPWSMCNARQKEPQQRYDEMGEEFIQNVSIIVGTYTGGGCYIVHVFVRIVGKWCNHDYVTGNDQRIPSNKIVRFPASFTASTITNRIDSLT